MKKQLIWLIGGAVLIIVLTLVFIPIYDNSLNAEENLRLPNRISSYSDRGYYKINPETILTSLESGDTNVFLPLLKDPQDITEDVTDMDINWTQPDFLRIASTLGQSIWNDPMDLKNWNVYYISFGGSCSDPVGFFSATITYFKTEGTAYTTRFIEINPYLGYVGWGDGETYPKPIRQKWNNVDLSGAKFTADDVLRIVSEDAKKRFQLTDHCGGLMATPQNSDPKNWYFHLLSTPDSVVYIVNLETGDYTVDGQNK